MILKKLVVENFRSYENQTVNFPSGSTLFSGDIGTGKTSILLAIEFALFGLQPSQKGNSLLRNGADESKVILNFEIEGKEIVIERTLKRKKNSVNQDYVSIIIDNEKFEESISEIKSKILNLLNYPKEFTKKTNLLYKFTVYTPQEEMKQIILESRDIRLNILRHVFGIDKYKRIEENSSILTGKLRERIRINEALLGNVEEIKSGLKEKEILVLKFREDFIDSEKNYNEAVKEREIKEKNLDEIQNRLKEREKILSESEKINLLINEKRGQVLRYSNDIKTIAEQIEEFEKLKFSEEGYDSVKMRIKVQKSKQEDMSKEYMELAGKIKSLENKKSETEFLLKKIFGIEKCPTCLQQVSQDYKKNILDNADNEIKILNSSVYECLKRKKDLEEKIKAVNNFIDKFEEVKREMEILKIKLDNLNEKRARILEMEKQITVLNEDIFMLMNQNKIMNEEIKNYEKYDMIFSEREKELRHFKEIEKEAAVKRAEINKEINFLEMQIKELKEKITKKEEIKIQTERLKSLENLIAGRFL